ncbi:MAG: redox-sensing transcriptional repressor Rex [Firmicutes bacterium]|jgi:redox-sensing transcriptional repressor|nr:redox-sensing transcriptional repressor Rex [Bacillota bacterium]
MAGLVSIPKPTLERLPVYYRVLVQCREAGMQYVSSSELGRRSGFDNAQVRKDLNHIWSGGRPGLGYEIDKLTSCLADFLGLHNTTDAALVGAGRLGAALAGYQGFAGYGLNIVAVFDSDPEKIGGTLSERPILSVDKLADIAERLGIRMGIITVPAKAAQAVADTMVSAGVQAIWNFAPVCLQVPKNVLVRNEDLAAGLATLSYHLKELDPLTNAMS